MLDASEDVGSKPRCGHEANNHIVLQRVGRVHIEIAALFDAAPRAPLRRTSFFHPPLLTPVRPPGRHRGHPESHVLPQVFDVETPCFSTWSGDTI